MAEQIDPRQQARYDAQDAIKGRLGESSRLQRRAAVVAMLAGAAVANTSIGDTALPYVAIVGATFGVVHSERSSARRYCSERVMAYREDAIRLSGPGEYIGSPAVKVTRSNGGTWTPVHDALANEKTAADPIEEMTTTFGAPMAASGLGAAAMDSMMSHYDLAIAMPIATVGAGIIASGSVLNARYTQGLQQAYLRQIQNIDGRDHDAVVKMEGN